MGSLLFAFGLAVGSWIILLRRARPVTPVLTAGETAGAGRAAWLVAANPAALDALCGHPSVLADAAKGARSRRVSIDVLAVPLLDESSLALLAAARLTLARRGLVLKLMGCSASLSSQLHERGLDDLVASRPESRPPRGALGAAPHEGSGPTLH